LDKNAFIIFLEFFHETNILLLNWNNYFKANNKFFKNSVFINSHLSLKTCYSKSTGALPWTNYSPEGTEDNNWSQSKGSWTPTPLYSNSSGIYAMVVPLYYILQRMTQILHEITGIHIKEFASILFSNHEF
jgi:hypothetical protein